MMTTTRRDYLRGLCADALTAEVRSDRKTDFQPAEAKPRRRELYTLEEQAACALEGSPGIFRVPSASRGGVRYRVDLNARACDCPGARSLKRKSFCRHIEAVYLKISSEILEIVGAPDNDTIEAAIRDIEAGCLLLATRYLCQSGQAPRYGYAPNCRAGAAFSIGLKPDARRTLSAIEIQACRFALRGLIVAERMAA